MKIPTNLSEHETHDRPDVAAEALSLILISHCSIHYPSAFETVRDCRWEIVWSILWQFQLEHFPLTLSDTFRCEK